MPKNKKVELDEELMLYGIDYRLDMLKNKIAHLSQHSNYEKLIEELDGVLEEMKNLQKKKKELSC